MLCAASSLEELGRRFNVAFRSLFDDVPTYGLYAIDDWTGAPRLVTSTNVSDVFLARYEEYGRGSEPLEAHRTATGRPAYNIALMSMEEWLESSFYTRVCGLHNFRHLVQVPVAGEKAILGDIHFATSDPTRGFTPHEIRLAEALGRVVGATIEKIQALDRFERERDQAWLALGLTGVAVVMSARGALEPRPNDAAQRLLAQVVDGQQHLYKLLARPGTGGGFSRQTDVELIRGGSGLLCGFSSVAHKHGDALITVLELQRDDSEISEVALMALTPREREVVLRVVEGLTDREIAERLHLSPHTVSQHVKRAYRKLGVDSRVSLTRLLLAS
jgi:DNA-binding CsgD family transcriptional regulator